MGYLSKLINRNDIKLLILAIFSIYIIGKIIGKERLYNYDSISGIDTRYTYGEIQKFESQSEGSMEAIFYIKIKGRYYDGSFPLIDEWSKNLDIKSKILYKFNIKNPDDGKVIYGYYVDSIKDVGEILKYPPKPN
jgi:hypothetical protein